jgi:hypothetical protein
MSARLRAYAAGLLEAGWLTAALVVPLAFYVDASPSFEPAKVALLRILVALMLAAWVVRATLGPTGPRRRGLAAAWAALRRGNPLALPALLLLLAAALSTLTAVSPLVSLLGGHNWGQGLCTTLCYVALFLLVASSVR